MRVAPCSVWSSVITKACSIVCTCVLFTYVCLPLHVEGEFPIHSVFLMWLRPQYSQDAVCIHSIQLTDNI